VTLVSSVHTDAIMRWKVDLGRY